MLDVFIFDTETTWIEGAAAPPPEFVVGGSLTQLVGGAIEYWDNRDDLAAAVIDIAEEGGIIVGHNLAFDLEVIGVVPGVHWKCHDTMIVDLLQRLAEDDWHSDHGVMRLRSLEKLFGAPLPGKDDVRKTFQPGVPLTDKQLRYLDGDVRATASVAGRQLLRPMPGGYTEVTRQLRAAMAFQRMTRLGIPIDKGAIAPQEGHQRKRKSAASTVLQKVGLYSPDRTGPRGGKYKAKLNVKPFHEKVLALSEAAGLEVAKTEKGAPKTDRDALAPFADDPAVAAWLEYKDAEKLLGFLKAWGSTTDRIHPRFSFMIRTGRASSSNPNLMQVPSRGKRGELKRVFVPPAGRVFYELDYAQLEMCCIAQLTMKSMMRMINDGQDLHRYLGAKYHRKPEAEVTDDERQLMKCANFGFPGGMFPRKFRAFVRSCGLPDPGHDVATDLRNTWLATYPEMVYWLRDPADADQEHIAVWSGQERVKFFSPETIHEAWQEAARRAAALKLPPQFRTDVAAHRPSRALERWLSHRRVVVDGGRVRCPVSYTEWHNTKFQGLAANLAKEAMSQVVLEMDHCDVQAHVFVHDSLLISVPDAPVQEEIVAEVAEVMLRSAKRWLPHLLVAVEICGPGHSWHEAKHAKKIKVEKF